MYTKNTQFVTRLSSVIDLARHHSKGSIIRHSEIIEEIFEKEINHKGSVWTEVMSVLKEKYSFERSQKVNSLYETIFQVLRGQSETKTTKLKALTRLLEMFDALNIKERNDEKDTFGETIYELIVQLKKVTSDKKEMVVKVHPEKRSENIVIKVERPKKQPIFNELETEQLPDPEEKEKVDAVAEIIEKNVDREEPVFTPAVDETDDVTQKDLDRLEKMFTHIKDVVVNGPSVRSKTFLDKLEKEVYFAATMIQRRKDKAQEEKEIAETSKFTSHSVQPKKHQRHTEEEMTRLKEDPNYTDKQAMEELHIPKRKREDMKKKGEARRRIEQIKEIKEMGLTVEEAREMGILE